MTTTTPAPAIAPDQEIAKLSTKELRARVLAEFESKIESDGRFAEKFVAIVKCRSAGLEDKDDVLHTAVKMKQSSYEYGTKVAMGVKLQGGDLTDRYKTRRHYVIQLREAPTDPAGNTINLKLDHELGSVLVECVEIGRRASAKEDGDAVAVVTFKAYEGKEDDADSGAAKCSLSLAVEGDWFCERWELGQAYRLSILPAPKWLEGEDKRRREEEKAEKAARKEARERRALEKAAKGVHPDQMGLFGQGPGDRPKDGEAEAVAALFHRDAPADEPAPVNEDHHQLLVPAHMKGGWVVLEAGGGISHYPDLGPDEVPAVKEGDRALPGHPVATPARKQ